MDTDLQRDEARYKAQGFGNEMGMVGKIGLLIVDFVNGFADPQAFGGGNIPQAIARTTVLLAAARRLGWKIAHTRIVFADDGADANIFSLKVPTMLGLTEGNPRRLFRDHGSIAIRSAPTAIAGRGGSRGLDIAPIA